VIECDPVLVGPERDTPSADEGLPPEGELGVRSLVDRHAPTPRVRKEEKVELEVAPSVTEWVRSCGTKALGTALAVANGSGQNPVSAALSVFRAVVDLEHCVESTLERVTIRAGQERAVELCKENGGEPIGFVRETLTCEVPPDHPIR
jgi:hypothetical protein